MNRRYILPATCALAFHTALLLGFRGSPPPIDEVADEPTLIEWVPKPPSDDYVPPADPDDYDSEVKAQRGRRDAGNPSLPDPPQPSGPKDFVVETAKPQPWKAAATHISTQPFGVPDGVLDGIGVDQGLLDVSKLDNTPQVRNQVAPIYPAEARRLGLDGQVLVGFTVDTDGRVMAPHVLECTDRIFVDAALRAVAKWRFSPGRSHGRIVRFSMAVPIVFQMNE